MNVIIIFILLLLFVGCKTAEIPFEFDNEQNRIPSVMLSFSRITYTDRKSVEMKFAIDTGCYISTFYNNALKKLFYTEKEFDTFINNFCEQEKVNRDDLEKSVAMYISIPKIRCGTYEFKKIRFENTSFVSENFDGLLGYEVFKNFGVMVLDFRKNVLILGKRIVNMQNSVPIQIKKVEFGSLKTYFLSIPVEIDGRTCDVILDTGYSSKGKPSVLTAASIDFPDEVCVKIGSFLYENVSRNKWTDGTFANTNMQEIAECLFQEIFILGNAFFQNHRIQLDFENMTFAMD